MLRDIRYLVQNFVKTTTVFANNTISFFSELDTFVEEIF